MNKKILFIVPMVALVLAGCNTRNTSSSSTNPTSGGTDTSATTTGGTTTGGSATSATTGGTTTGGSSTTGTSTTGTSTTQTVIPVTKVYVDEFSMDVELNTTKQIGAHVVPENATDQGLVYSSANDAIATVSNAGLVTGVSAGSTVITVAAHENQQIKNTVTINVTDSTFVYPPSTSDGFTLLKSGDTLGDDDEVYFAGLNGITMYTMKKHSSDTFVPCSVATINDGVLTVGDGAEKYTIESGTDGFYFRDSSNKYLYAAGGSSNNYLKADASKKAESLFAVVPDDHGVSKVETSACERGSIRFNYNNGSPRFAAYDPSKTKLPEVSIYVKHAVKKDLQSIAVSGEKTEYMQGDTFVKPTVTATFSVGDPEDVTDEAVFSGYDLSKTGSQTVDVSYTYKGVTKTTSYGINVNADTLNSISINGDMTKKTYNLNDAWDPSGLTFVGHYTSGDKTISPELTYNPETANSTELTQVEVTATLSGVSKSKTITGINVVSKSSMQIAYEAAIKAGKTESTEQYTFTGTITGLMSPSKGFYVQDGDYAMYVYTPLPQGALVGKEVTVTSKVTCYNNVLPETSGTPSVVVNGDGATILPASVSSQQEINDLKINTLVSTKATVTSSFLSDVAAWSSSTSKNPKLNVGSDQITMNFDKNSYNDCKALQTAFAALKDGDEIDLTKAVVRCYSGTNQFGAMTETRIEVKADPITHVSIKTLMKNEYVAGQYLDPSDLVITVSHESGATEDVAYAGHESDFEFDPSLTTVLTTEHTELVITYKGIDLDPVPLTVVEKTIVSAIIKTQPSKLEYNEGELFDPSGLVLTVTYDDESTDDVVYTSLDEGFEFDPDLDTPLTTEDVSVSVTYVDKSAGSVAITVSAKPQTAYTRVSSNLSDWSGTYLLVYESSESEAFCWNGVDSAYNYVTTSVSSGVISETPMGASTLTISSMAGGYSLKINGGENDGKYVCHTGSKNTLNFSDTAVANVLSISDGSASIKVGEYILRYNNTAGDTNQRFRYYKSGQKPIQLYKLG